VIRDPEGVTCREVVGVIAGVIVAEVGGGETVAAVVEAVAEREVAVEAVEGGEVEVRSTCVKLYRVPFSQPHVFKSNGLLFAITPTDIFHGQDPPHVPYQSRHSVVSPFKDI